MKSLTVIFRDQALYDLEEIWLYTFQNCSQTQADRYHSLIVKEVEFLSVNPESGRDRSDLRKGYFSSKIKSHIIF
ncbi:type II toxin-antitoxin system RelE/ParE family toxin [Ferruginibacter sp. HRS2-29]|uniref:type II toxin-antitoxin system RelE/ParE family toxin n=1 Tax=Ferruginibacter sp. HRS2-29 TaxID=2487334 RepID=UPI0034E98528